MSHNFRAFRPEAISRLRLLTARITVLEAKWTYGALHIIEVRPDSGRTSCSEKFKASKVIYKPHDSLPRGRWGLPSDVMYAFRHSRQ